MNEAETITPAAFKDIFGHDPSEWHDRAHEMFMEAKLHAGYLQLYIEGVRAATAEKGTQTPDHRIPDHYLTVADARLRAIMEAMDDVQYALSRHVSNLDRKDGRLNEKKTDHLESFLKGQGWFE